MHQVYIYIFFNAIFSTVTHAYRIIIVRQIVSTTRLKIVIGEIKFEVNLDPSRHGMHLP